VVYEGKTIAVVVPAHNEEKMISQVLNTMPDFVDLVVVVDDASTDRTAEIVTSYSLRPVSRVRLIQHDHNQGVGAAIITGYKVALAQDMDVVVVMNGDAQMDPDDLPRLVEPVVRDETDYAKGNRLFRGESWRMIPHHRYLGNSVLSLLTKIASGYWHVADSQTGYTVISRTALQRFERASDRIVRRSGLTPRQYLLLLTLEGRHAGSASIGTLSQELLLAQSTVTELADRAQADGLVERVVARHDARVVLVGTTREGARRLGRALEALDRERDRLGTAIDELNAALPR